MVIGHGVEVPNSVGLHGGMPGACAYHLLRPSNEGSAALIERYHDAASVMSDSARQISAPSPATSTSAGATSSRISSRAAAAMATRCSAIRRGSRETCALASLAALGGRPLWRGTRRLGPGRRGSDVVEAKGDSAGAPGRANAAADPAPPAASLDLPTSADRTAISTAPAAAISVRRARIGRQDGVATGDDRGLRPAYPTA